MGQKSTSLQVLSIIAIVFGVVGSAIAFWSAITAFLAVGSNPDYSSRLWAGWIALLLPIAAAVATLFLRAHPIAATTLILVSGIAGAICINLFYINTFYLLALPFWLLAVATGLAGNSRAKSGTNS